MRRSMRPHTSPGQRGVALLVGLVFLMVLSVVALMAMRGTIAEMQLVNNAASHEQAFEVSESSRAVAVALFDEHTVNRGWPAIAMGGSVADSSFESYPQCGEQSLGRNGISCATLAGTRVRQAPATGPVNLYEISFQTGEKPYDPSSWMGSPWDMRVELCREDDCSGGYARIWIRPGGTALEEGNGVAQAAGYRGLGTGAADGGGAMYFDVLSEGSVDSLKAVTLSQYRQRISH